MLATLIREQVRLGWHVEIYYFVDSGGAQLYSGICDVHFSGRQSLTSLLLTGDYDIVHVVSAAAQSAELCLMRSCYSGGVVVTCHGSFGGDAGSGHVVAVSNYTARAIQENYRSQVSVIYNGVDTDRFYPKPMEGQDKPIIAWIGRTIDPYKDTAGLFALAGSSAAEHFRFVLVDGSADDWELANWLPSGSEVRNRVGWLDMPSLYWEVAASGGFVLSTSRLEACPMNILEAQACGCPVIAPAVGGIPEIVAHRSTGYLYDRKDGLSGLRSALEWLYSGDNYQRASREAAEHIRRNFTARRMCEQYADIYKHAATARRCGTGRRLICAAFRSGVRLVLPRKRRMNGI